jgi:hypothetical protein
MKNKNGRMSLSSVWIYILLTSFLFSCCRSNWNVPSDYVGKWETRKEKITVRTKSKNEPFRFTADSASVTIIIHGDKTVSGTIGLAEFTHARLKKNTTLPWETGVEYIIECGSIGNIFHDDPLDHKEVEIWFAPIQSDGISNSELRYTDGMAHFPMARLLFVKVRK